MTSDLDAFLCEYETNHGIDKTYRCCQRFMLTYLSLSAATLPEVAKDGLSIFGRFDAGLGTPAELESARVRCWEYLELRSESTQLDTPSTCAIRAAICLLYPSASNCDDLYELVSWFLTLANRVEDHTDQLDSLLMQSFNTSSP